MKLISIATYQEKEYAGIEGVRLAAAKSIMLNIESIVSIEHLSYEQAYFKDSTEYYLVKTMRPDMNIIISETAYRNIIQAKR